MLNVPEFKAAMVRKGYNQKTLAEKLGISERTFCERIKMKRFGTEEIEKLIPLLEIRDPMTIFFDGVVTCKVTDQGKEANVCLNAT
ncbi:MAG: helix-turn-helix domain-containing protein [Ruminococcus sp.]|nr:helix-turn-helix domain-containing protein [Ruminococcus sp.]